MTATAHDASSHLVSTALGSPCRTSISDESPALNLAGAAAPGSGFRGHRREQSFRPMLHGSHAPAPGTAGPPGHFIPRYLAKTCAKRKELRSTVYLCKTRYRCVMVKIITEPSSTNSVTSQDVSASHKTNYCLCCAAIGHQTAATQIGTGVPLVTYVAILS